MPLQSEQFANEKEETQAETQWQDLPLIVAHNPETAAAQTKARRSKIAELEQQAALWVIDILPTSR